MPHISLAMPVYNGENFIGAAIDSLLSQTYSDFELIVTDNASKDGTREIVEGYAKVDSRVRYIRNIENIGAAPNYNLGFEHSTGEFFKWCAHDDLHSENYLEECLRMLRNDDALSIVHARTEGLDELDRPAALNGVGMPEVLNDHPGIRFETVLNFDHDCYHIFGLMRSDMLRKTGLQNLYYGTDRALLAEMAILGKIGVAEQATFFSREHSARSVNLESNLQRAVWHNGNANRWGAAEKLNLLRDLLDISKRHAEVVSAWDTRRRIFKFAMRPSSLKRYGVETLDLTLPGLANAIRRTKMS
jgi:glycosyltransferase involved in cell wall biosynthesis